MQVTLAKALKVKNQVAGKLGKLQSYVQQYNRVLEVNKDRYPVRDKLVEFGTLHVSFVKLKQAIANANAPIQGAIVALAETKGLLSFYDDIPTDDATVIRNSYNGERNEETYVVTFDESAKAEAVRLLEKRIVELQDELDTFNATTKIEIDDSLVA